MRTLPNEAGKTLWSLAKPPPRRRDDWHPPAYFPTDEWTRGERTLGPHARELAGSVGLKLLPWQGYVLDEILRCTKDGWRHPFFTLGLARQNGKSTILQVRWLVSLLARQNALAGSQSRGLVIEMIAQLWTDMLEGGYERAKFSRLSGGEALHLDGTQVVVVASNRKAARGRTVGLVTVDEAREVRAEFLEASQPALATADGWGQVVIASNAGDERSQFWWELVEQGRLGKHAHAEWSAHDRLDRSDPAAHKAGNPSYGVLISPRVIERELLSMSPAAFDRERLSRWSGGAIDQWLEPAEWNACTSPGTVQPGVKTYCAVATTPTGDHGVIAASAERLDGLIHIECVNVYDRPGDSVATIIAERVRELHARWRFQAVLYHPATPAAAVAARLARVRVPTAPVTGGKFTEALYLFRDAVHRRTVAHPPEQLVQVQLATIPQHCRFLEMAPSYPRDAVIACALAAGAAIKEPERGRPAIGFAAP